MSNMSEFPLEYRAGDYQDSDKKPDLFHVSIRYIDSPDADQDYYTHNIENLPYCNLLRDEFSHPFFYKFQLIVDLTEITIKKGEC
jgi:hypothetical protein